jgi:exo-beta-1,3-glucanase (GH17 family)
MAAIKAKGFTTVRLYSSDCSGLTNVGASCAAIGLELIVGIFVDNKGIGGAQTQVTDLTNFKHWDIVVLVVVGNECVFNGYATAGALVSFIQSCRSSFASVGYTGPITTTEPLNVLQANAGTLCGAIDVVGCNIHPFFNSDVTAATAGSFVASQLAIVEGLCPGKQGINLETGWPSAGTCNGKACPSQENQAVAVASIAAACGGKSIMFSFIDDMWKKPGAFSCEQSWGVAHLW